MYKHHVVIANGYSTSHFDHMYTWTPDWACSDIIEYESATECDLSDSTVEVFSIDRVLYSISAIQVVVNPPIILLCKEIKMNLSQYTHSGV
jgi:hypothetical protein